MRRLIAAAVVLLVFGAAPAATTPQPFARPCTEQGTANRDVIAGGQGSDVLCLRRGDDYGHGGGGNDEVRGGGGTDTVVGGTGKDEVRGGGGNDLLFVIDQLEGNDHAHGGPGWDRCFLDDGDVAAGCEVVHRSGSPVPAAAFAALTASFLGAARLGEDAQDDVRTLCGGQPAPPPICPKGD